MYETIVDYAKDYLGPTEINILDVLLIALGVIASLGGISVLVGTYMIRKGRKGTGKFIVGLGASMGLIGLILLIATTVIGREGLTGTYQLLAGMATGASGLGVLQPFLVECGSEPPLHLNRLYIIPQDFSQLFRRELDHF